MTSVGTFLFAIALTIVLSALVRHLPAPSAIPVPDRWHRAVTPLTGGIALFVAFSVSLLPAFASGAIADRYNPVIVIAAGAFALGLIDDLWHIGVVPKLGGQVVLGLAAAHEGLRPDWVPPSVGIPVACLVIVASMNSLNLLDNMDGLAAGTAAVAALGLAAVSGLVEHAGSSVVAAALAGAAVGFLPFNFRPRRPALLFMGDSGSQLLGFSLGALALLTSPGGAGGVAAAVVAPLLILAVPALDTGLVVLVRLGQRRPIWQGGRDHSSHRLVYRGLTERRAVAVLLAITAACTATAVMIVIFQNPLVTAVAAAVTGAALAAFGIRLAIVREDDSAAPLEAVDRPTGALVGRP
jgi:UDP-GlcNAc:undecaprenyl-phosphate/decaprenyl-phosphate GlcNAc-1-phosphate transferase